MSSMLVQNGPYVPRIADAGHFCRGEPRSARRITTPLCTYSIHAFAGGEVRIGNGPGQATRDEGIILVRPGEQLDWDLFRATHVWYLHFLVRYEPEWDQASLHGNFNMGYDKARPFLQPGPQDVWGMELPRLLPEENLQHNLRLLTRITNNWDLGRADNQVEANLLLSLLLNRLIVRFRRLAQADRRHIEEAMFQAKYFAQTKVGSGLTVKHLADHVQMERAQFTRRFSDCFGVGPGAFLRYLRLQRAIQMLARQTDLDIGTIALKSGYADHAGFTRAFRSVYGQSPEQYRQAHPRGRSRKFANQMLNQVLRKQLGIGPRLNTQSLGEHKVELPKSETDPDLEPISV